MVNTGGLIDLAFTDEFSNITAILQFVQAGQEGGNALADVISGKVTPSGKMTDTWALDYMDYPNAAYFSHKSGDVYREEYRKAFMSDIGISIPLTFRCATVLAMDCLTPILT